MLHGIQRHIYSRCMKLTRKSERGSERVSIGVSVEREARESLNI